MPVHINTGTSRVGGGGFPVQTGELCQCKSRTSLAGLEEIFQFKLVNCASASLEYRKQGWRRRFSNSYWWTVPVRQGQGAVPVSVDGATLALSWWREENRLLRRPQWRAARDLLSPQPWGMQGQWRGERRGQSNHFRRQMVMHAPTAAALPLVHVVPESVVTRLVVDLSGPAATTSSVPQWMFYNMRGVMSGHSDTHWLCLVLQRVCTVLGVM